MPARWILFSCLLAACGTGDASSDDSSGFGIHPIGSAPQPTVSCSDGETLVQGPRGNVCAQYDDNRVLIQAHGVDSGRVIHQLGVFHPLAPANCATSQATFLRGTNLFAMSEVFGETVTYCFDPVLGLPTSESYTFVASGAGTFQYTIDAIQYGNKVAAAGATWTDAAGNVTSLDASTVDLVAEQDLSGFSPPMAMAGLLAPQLAEAMYYYGALFGLYPFGNTALGHGLSSACQLWLLSSGTLRDQLRIECGMLNSIGHDFYYTYGNTLDVYDQVTNSDQPKPLPRPKDLPPDGSSCGAPDKAGCAGGGLNN